MQPVHAGWSSVRKPTTADGSPEAVCYEAVSQALVPRIEPKSARMAQFLDQQIYQLARDGQQKTDDLYARIQSEFQEMMPPAIGEAVPGAAIPQPAPKETAPQLRGM